MLPAFDGIDAVARPLGLVGESYALAWRQRRRVLVASTPVLVTALVVSSAISIATAAPDGVIATGKLVARRLGHRWTEATLHISAGSNSLNVAVPALLLLGWILAVVVCVPILAGAATGETVSIRSAWTRALRRSPTWACVVVVIGATTVGLAFAATVAGSTELGSFGFLVVAIIGVVVLARLSLALPVALVEPFGPVGALRWSWTVTRGRTRDICLALIVGTTVLPVLAFSVASWLADRVVEAPWWGSIQSPAAAVGVVTLFDHVVLIAVLPMQASVLAWSCLVARRTSSSAITADGAAGATIATAGDGASAMPLAASRDRSLPAGWGVIAGLAIAALLPAVVATGYVLVNPDLLTVVSVGRAQPWALRQPLATRTLATGKTVIVDSMQIIGCSDARCDDSSTYALPCLNGAAPQPMGPGASGCSIEAPLSAATVRADGTVIALRRVLPNALRMYWCRPAGEQYCTWGGATTIFRPPSLWEVWSTAVTDAPGGGVVATFIGPAADGKHGQVLVIACDELACADPHVSHVGDVSLPDGWSGGGALTLAVDQVGGSVAVAYQDGQSGEVWLGGCTTVACTDATFTPVRGWPPLAPGPIGRVPDQLALAATPRGPVLARLDVSPGQLASDQFLVHPFSTDQTPDSARPATVVICDGIRCETDHRVSVMSPPGGPQLATDAAGDVFMVGTSERDGADQSVLVGIPRDRLSQPTYAALGSYPDTRVLAATIPADGRPRLLLDSDRGLVLLTCADPHCRSGA